MQIELHQPSTNRSILIGTHGTMVPLTKQVHQEAYNRIEFYRAFADRAKMELNEDLTVTIHGTEVPKQVNCREELEVWYEMEFGY